jgi:hypothetical protein
VQRVDSDAAAATAVEGVAWLQPAGHLIGEHDVGQLALTCEGVRKRVRKSNKVSDRGN